MTLREIKPRNETEIISFVGEYGTTVHATVIATDEGYPDAPLDFELIPAQEGISLTDLVRVSRRIAAWYQSGPVRSPQFAAAEEHLGEALDILDDMEPLPGMITRLRLLDVWRERWGDVTRVTSYEFADMLTEHGAHGPDTRAFAFKLLHLTEKKDEHGVSWVELPDSGQGAEALTARDGA